MTERTEQPEEAVRSTRGDAAWKAEKDAIAARNERARKAGREVRQAQDARRVQRQRAEDLRERAAMADVLKRRS